MRLIGAGHRQPHRLSTGREQQPVVGNAGGAGEPDFAPRAIDADDLAIQMQLDAAIGVERVGTERQPILGRAAGEVVFRQVRPVDRRRPLGAQHDEASLIVAPPQHFGCSKTGGAAANDHDLPGRWRRRAFAARLWLLELVG